MQKETSPWRELSVAELDLRLEQAVRENERSEQLLCEYLVEMRDRRGHEQFGFVNIWDYAAERFGFCERKTRYMLGLGTKLKRLPKIREALASGKLGWSKAAKVAAVATSEDEAMWLDSALLAFRAGAGAEDTGGHGRRRGEAAGLVVAGPGGGVGERGGGVPTLGRGEHRRGAVLGADCRGVSGDLRVLAGGRA